jgi:hypothetical protein
LSRIGLRSTAEFFEKLKVLHIPRTYLYDIDKLVKQLNLEGLVISDTIGSPVGPFAFFMYISPSARRP